MPSPRINIYIQNNFVVGERKTSLSFDQGTSSSVQELVNYRVLKSGSIKRRFGTRLDFHISGIDVNSEILKFLEFADGFVVLVKIGTEVKLYYLGTGIVTTELVPSAYMVVRYKADAVNLAPSISSIGSHTDVLAEHDDNPLVIRDIEELGTSIFLLFEKGLPYRLFLEGGSLYIAPYYYTTDLGNSYDSFIRSLPISNIPSSFSNIFFERDGTPVSASESVLTVGNENLDTGTCRAFLSFSGALDVETTMVDTSKMALEEYLFKPIIFNVIPSTPEFIDFDVGSRYNRRGTTTTGVPTLDLAYIADWDLDATYSSDLLGNLNRECNIRLFSYDPTISSSSAAAIGDFGDIIGSKAQLIRELLYGRKYMIIPYETVGVNERRIEYHTALVPATNAEDAVTSTEVVVETLATGLSRVNEEVFSAITIRNFTLKRGTSPSVLIKGTITRAIPGLDDLRAAASFSTLRAAFPENYVQINNEGVRGTRFNQLPWSTVVIGDWRNSFLGASISRGATGRVDNEVLNRNVVITLHSGILVDSAKVFDGVSSILVYKPGVIVNNDTSPSGTVARFVANAGTNPDGPGTRDFVYDSGGLDTVNHPSTSREVRNNFLSYRVAASTRALERSYTFSPHRGSDNRIARFMYCARGTRSFYQVNFTHSPTGISMEEPFLRKAFRQPRGTNIDIEGVVSGINTAGYLINKYQRNREWAYIALGDVSTSDTLPHPDDDDLRDFIAPYIPLDGVDDEYRFIQACSDEDYIYMLFREEGGGSTYYLLTYVEHRSLRTPRSHRFVLELEEKAEIDWSDRSDGDGSVILSGFSVDRRKIITLASFDNFYVTESRADSGDDINRSDSTITRFPISSGSGSGNIVEVAFPNRDFIYSMGDDNRVLRRMEQFYDTTTVTTPVPNEEVSVLKDFFNTAEDRDGNFAINITLVRPSNDRGFQGFEVIPYNIPVDTAFGFNSVTNNEYISDNRHATGAFAFPVLDKAGLSAIGLGSVTAFGRHIIATDTGDFFTWFAHILKGGALSSLNTIFMRIGGLNGTTYTLHRQSIASLRGNVEVFIQDVSDFVSVMDSVVAFSSPATIEFFFDGPIVTGSGTTIVRQAFSYMTTRLNDRVANVYANCLIFELGMPSTARKDGTRVIGGNDFDLGYSTNKVAYSTDDYNYTAFTTFNNNFNLIRDDSISYVYQNENRANNLLRILNNPDNDELKDLFRTTRYNPGSFEGRFPSVIPLYLANGISQASYVINDSPQVQTFDNYINRTGFRSQVDYLKRVINPRGRSVNLTSAVSSFDGAGILVASEEGLYNVPSAPGGAAALVHNQRFKFKPLVFHNRFVFVSPDDLLITQVRSRERLGLKSTYSGADQINLLSPVLDIVFDQDSQVYMMPDTSGDIVVATDFDTSVSGFAKWKFADDVKCLKLLASSKGVKGIFKKGTGMESSLSLLTFDDSIVEDFKPRVPIDARGEPFTSRLVSNSLIASDNADAGLFRGHIKKIQIDYNLCSQIVVEFVADNTISVEYDYVKQDSKGVSLDYNQPLESGGGVIGYNPRVILSQSGLEDCNGVIYGFKYTGVLDGF